MSTVIPANASAAAPSVTRTGPATRRTRALAGARGGSLSVWFASTGSEGAGRVPRPTLRFVLQCRARTTRPRALRGARARCATKREAWSWRSDDAARTLMGAEGAVSRTETTRALGGAGVDVGGMVLALVETARTLVGADAGGGSESRGLGNGGVLARLADDTPREMGWRRRRGRCEAGVRAARARLVRIGRGRDRLQHRLRQAQCSRQDHGRRIAAPSARRARRPREVGLEHVVAALVDQRDHAAAAHRARAAAPSEGVARPRRSSRSGSSSCRGDSPRVRRLSSALWAAGASPW